MQFVRTAARADRQTLSVADTPDVEGAARERVRGPTEASNKAEELAGRKAKKKMRAEGIALFNEKPRKGIAQLQAQGLLADDAAEVAVFLKQTEGLDYAAVGDFLSDPADSCKEVPPAPARCPVCQHWLFGGLVALCRHPV